MAHVNILSFLAVPRLQQKKKYSADVSFYCIISVFL